MSLLLDVSGVEREVGESLRFRLEGAPPAGAEMPGGVRLGPIAAEGRAIWTGEAFLAEGRAQAAGSFTCSRCCRPFTETVAGEFAREFRPADDRPVPRATGEAEPDRDDQEPAEPFSGGVIDLAFPAWEALVLELPMKPVCRVDCAGLCPVCGSDLNEKACGCQAEKADSRFLTLKKLLEAKERGE